MDGTGTFERRFYLEHFRGRGILVAERGGAGSDDQVGALTDTLLAAGARVVRVRAGAGSVISTDDDAVVGRFWPALLATGSADLRAPGGVDPLDAGVALARRLRPFKLVLADPSLPAADRRPTSFVTLHDGDDVGRGAPHAALARLALDAGVGSVNVCRPAEVAAELLTYEGAGVLYTRDRYCQVQRLGMDDFEGATRLIEQGIAEGYLLPRTPAQVGELLVTGYGARFGDDHLAGVASLLTASYTPERLGEVSGLTTISRFAGGGVGGMIVATMLEDARTSGLEGVFACTTSSQAAAFFSAMGFTPVEHDLVPDAKWVGYDPGRRAQVRALLHDLTEVGEPR